MSPFVGFVAVADAFACYPVDAIHPSCEILQLAPLAAEWPPLRIDRMDPAEHAQRELTINRSDNCSSILIVKRLIVVELGLKGLPVGDARVYDDGWSAA